MQDADTRNASGWPGPEEALAGFVLTLKGLISACARSDRAALAILVPSEPDAQEAIVAWSAPELDDALRDGLTQSMMAEYARPQPSPPDAETSFTRHDGYRIAAKRIALPRSEGSASLILAYPPDDKRSATGLTACAESVEALFAYRSATGRAASDALAAETGKLATELELLREKDRIADIAGELAEFGSWSADFRTKAVTWTRQLQKIHEIPDDMELTPQQGMALFDSPHRERLFGLIMRLKETGEGFDVETPARTLSGGHRMLRVMARGEQDDGVTIKAHGCVLDITRQKEAQRVIETMAISDSLTGLLNRRSFEERIAKFQCPCALVLLDVDHFKIINDTEGHQMGDQVLIAVAEALRQRCAPDDLIGRFGGDEFLAAISCKSLADAEQRINALTESIEKMAPRIGLHAPLTVSLGFMFIEHENTLRFLEAFKRVDQTLYEAKRRGRALSLRYDATIGKKFEAKSTILFAIEQALASGDVLPHYQPKICLKTGRIVGFEALARWKRSEGDIVGPSDFFQALEDPVYSARISEQILDTVVDDAAQLRSAGLDFGSVAVNVTEFQITDEAFVDRLMHRLEKHSLAPASIEIELTEGILLSRYPKRIEDRLERLRALGFRIAFDDFGTGFASLTHLHRFPIDVLKIDMSFVHAIERDQSARSIVGALIGMANELGLTVVAEGVETRGAEAILRTMGCDLAQGFLYSPAVPFEGAKALLAATPPIASTNGR